MSQHLNGEQRCEVRSDEMGNWPGQVYRCRNGETTLPHVHLDETEAQSCGKRRDQHMFLRWCGEQAARTTVALEESRDP